jgi:hypothetical protein
MYDNSSVITASIGNRNATPGGYPVVNIVNQSQLGGGFRHYSGLLPAVPGDGDSQALLRPLDSVLQRPTRAAMFRGDIAVIADSTHRRARRRRSSRQYFGAVGDRL